MPLLCSPKNCCETSFQAVRSDHLQCLAEMSKEALDALDIYGQTALHLAAKLGHLDIVE